MAKGRIEANDIVADNYLSKAIQSATVYEQHLLQITGYIQTILADTIKLGAATGTGDSASIQRLIKLYDEAKVSVNALTEAENTNMKLKAQLQMLINGEADDTIRLRKEIQQLTAQKRTNAEVTQAEIGAYQEAVNKLHQMKRAVLDLLVAEKANTAEAKNLITEYERLNKVVRKAEEGVGQYHRNVGNYASGQRKYNYEMFQMTQIMRELPDFAMSARIGVMALSNNLPQLGDAFRKIATDTKEGTDQMNGYGFAAKTMLKSVFSWQSLMLVGITIAVAYADAIGKWVSSLWSGNNALKVTQDALAKLNEDIDKAGKENINNTITQTTHLRLLIDVLGDENATLKEKKKAQKEINEIAPEYLGNITTENYNTDESVKAIDRYITSLNRKAKAQAVFNKLVKSYEKESDIGTLLTSENQPDSAYEGVLTKEQLSDIRTSGREDIMQKWRSSNLVREGHRAVWVSYKGVKTLMTDPDRFGPMAEEEAVRQVLKDMLNATQKRSASLYAQAQSFGLDISNKKPDKPKTPKKEEEQGHIELENRFQDWYKIQMKYISDSQAIALDMEEIRHNNYLSVKRSDKEIEEETDRHHDEVIRIKISKLEKERLLMIQKFGFDSNIAPIDSEIGRLKSELNLADQSKPKKEKTPANAMKDTANAMVQLGQALDQFLDAQEKRRQQQIERQIDATKRRQDDLKLLASIGSKDAKDSLAIEEKRQAELERKQDQIARRNAKRQLGIAALNSYSAKVGRGDVNATASTISDIATLMGFISALPGFYEGTENVEKSLGKPSIKGKDGYVIRVDGKERVLNPTQNMKIGNMSNEDLAELAYSHRTKSVKSNAPLYNDEIINKLDSVEKAIKSQPIYDTAWNEQEQAIQRTITAGNFVQKELFKTGGVWRK